ncbi:MAG TPA: nucleotidyltransferase family protein [Candidatus Desulfaltia sp.]|nr:nucleotidyltransferase family protein [Candidatus Desulfaltia sp.]
MIWAVVLAAGESRRMGRPKLLLPYGKETIIETVVRTVVASSVDRTLVVLGGHRKEIEEKIHGFAVKKVINREYRKGMFSSVLCGLGSLPRSARAAVLVLADQPGIPAGVIDSLVESFRRKKKGLVVPVYRKKRGHPLLLDLKYLREVEALPPDVGLRGLLRGHPEDILEVHVSTPEILRDIDSPGDYRKTREIQAK